MHFARRSAGREGTALVAAHLRIAQVRAPLVDGAMKEQRARMTVAHARRANTAMRWQARAAQHRACYLRRHSSAQVVGTRLRMAKWGRACWISPCE